MFLVTRGFVGPPASPPSSTGTPREPSSPWTSLAGTNKGGHQYKLDQETWIISDPFVVQLSSLSFFKFSPLCINNKFIRSSPPKLVQKMGLKSKFRTFFKYVHFFGLNFNQKVQFFLKKSEFCLASFSQIFKCT